MLKATVSSTKTFFLYIPEYKAFKKSALAAYVKTNNIWFISYIKDGKMIN